MNFKILSFVGYAVFMLLIDPNTAQAQNKPYCREYTKTIWVGGVRQEGYGTACYQPDGSWEIVDLEGNAHTKEIMRQHIRNDIGRRNDRVIIIDRRSPRHHHPYYSEPGYFVYYDDHPWQSHHRRKNREYDRWRYSHWNDLLSDRWHDDWRYDRRR